MAQDCFLTFGIRRQMIMMQPGKLSILPLESKQWGVVNKVRANSDIVMPIAAIPYQVVGNDIANDGNSLCLSTYDYTIGKFKISGKRAQDDGSSKIWMQWIAICV